MFVLADSGGRVGTGLLVFLVLDYRTGVQRY